MIELQDITDSGKYQISSNGAVFNKVTGRKLKTYAHKRGYLMVAICVNGKRQGLYIHRLVATYYIPNPDNKPQVNHINGIVTDNSISNLEWVTEKENINHAYETGLVATEIKVKQAAKLDEIIVKEIREKYAQNKGSFKAMAKDYGVTGATIGHIIKRRTWTHI